MNKAKRRLQIEISKGGYHPFEPNKEEKQRLTILDNGMVWLTTYGLKTEGCWQYKAMRKERHRVGVEQAKAFIDKAVVLINSPEINDSLFVIECDADPDRITVSDANGYYCSKEFFNESIPAVQDFYEEIRKVITTKMLLEFDFEFYSE